MKRYLEVFIKEDLAAKMVFLGGPRQVGKTMLSFNILRGNERHPAYLNWDNPQIRKTVIQGELPGNEKLIIFDEIHKYKGWRNLVKGFYDTHKSERQFLVTGSARLDYYRRGGDSLQGRYHYYRLHPFSLFELKSKSGSDDLKHLLEYGGFPEPFLNASNRGWKRWQKERATRVIQDDLINLEHVREISQMQLLMDALPERVGSPLSIQNLKEDLSVAFETVERWVSILENLYFCFRIQPYGVKKLRTAKKEKKLYLWDWSQCNDLGKKFENLVASQLLKYCHFLEDTEGDVMELRFIRDVYKREIDFLVIRNRKLAFAVECKTGEKSLSPHISHFSARLPIPQFYQVHLGSKDAEVRECRTRIMPFHKFCELLGV